MVSLIMIISRISPRLTSQFLVRSPIVMTPSPHPCHCRTALPKPRPAAGSTVHIPPGSLLLLPTRPSCCFSLPTKATCPYRSPFVTTREQGLPPRAPHLLAKVAIPPHSKLSPSGTQALRRRPVPGSSVSGVPGLACSCLCVDRTLGQGPGWV